jgi:hypothetical protein
VHGAKGNISGYLKQYRDTGDVCLRAKWTMDGAETLAQAAAQLRAFADDLEALSAAGFHLRGRTTRSRST